MVVYVSTISGTATRELRQMLFESELRVEDSEVVRILGQRVQVVGSRYGAELMVGLKVLANRFEGDRTIAE